MHLYNNIAINDFKKNSLLSKEECNTLFEEKKDYTEGSSVYFDQLLQKLINLQRQNDFIDLSYIAFPRFVFKKFNFPENKPVAFTSASFAGNADFCKIIFHNNQNLDFTGVDFHKEVFLKESDFNNKVDFYQTSFLESIDLSSARFHQEVIFQKISFNCDCNFQNTYFEKGIFRDIIFSGKADFRQCTFNKDYSFSNVDFLHGANFSRTSFIADVRQEAYGQFYYVSFHKKTFFSNSVFKQAFFENVNFKNGADFIGAKCLEKMIFSYCNSDDIMLFTKMQFNTLDLRGSKFSDADYLDLRQYEQSTHHMAQGLKSKHFDNRETARLIKAHLEKQNNILEANKYFSFEQELYLKELKQKGFWNNKGAIFTIWLHKLISNSGTSWLKVLFWISMFSFLVLLWHDYLPCIQEYISNKKECQNNLLSWETLDRMVELINPANMFKNTNKLYQDNEFAGMIIRIITLYLFYQFVIAFRRLTRRK